MKNMKVMSNKNKIVYFIVGVDIDKGTKFIDDEEYKKLHELLSETDIETLEDYNKALAILNGAEWEKE